MSNFIDLNNSESNMDLSILSKNLCWLMDSKPIDALTLSDQTNIGLTTINKLRRGIGNPTYSTLVTLAGFFNIQVSQLTEIELFKGKKSKEISTNIPLLSLNEFKDFINGLKKPKDFVSIAIKEKTEHTFAIKIGTNSMSPFFEKGSIFILEQSIHPQDGDIVLVEFNEQNICFRKVFMEGVSYYFKTVTDSFSENTFKGDNFTIHAVVISVIQNFYSD